MANGKEIKPSSIMKRAIRYLIAFVVILIWLGLLANHWPTALAIAVIGGIIWRSRKSSHKKLPEITPGPVVTVKDKFSVPTSSLTMPGTNELQWASYEDLLEVAGYRIEHPMTYWTAGKTRIAEASCIEKNLPVGKPISEPIGALGYWPRYENMTPGQRGNYLSWLASGKQGQLDDIGYAFVGFASKVNSASKVQGLHLK